MASSENQKLVISLLSLTQVLELYMHNIMDIITPLCGKLGVNVRTLCKFHFCYQVTKI